MAASNTYTQIVENVQQALLTQEGRAHIAHRRTQAGKMADGLRALQSSGWFLKARRRTAGQNRTVFVVSQGLLQQAVRGLQVSVELRGVGVGKLLPPKNADDYPLLATSDKPVRKLRWGGIEAREYIRSRVEEVRPSPERELQGVLVRKMSSSPKHDLLKQLWPVCPARCMMEVPVPVNADGDVGTGNIDVLARTGTGRNSRYVVCELKKDRTSPYKALRQAVRYAAALDVEVNGIEGQIAPADRSIYRTLFGSKSSSRASLIFGSMAVIPRDYCSEDQAQKAVAELRAGDAWLDVMLFDGVKDADLVPSFRTHGAD